MRIVGCQCDIVWEDKQANYKRVRSLLRNAQVPSGSLIVLAEMFATGFSMNVSQIQESDPSGTEEFLRELAREQDAFVLAGLVAKCADGRARNQAVAFAPDGRLLARYSKIHPFTRGGEAAHYAPGTEITTFDWNGCTVCPFVCYDLRFPEVFRTGVRRGAQLFAVIANWPVAREGHWVTLLQARAIENQACVVGVNRSGTDPKYVYPGRSMIVDPHGTILTEIGNKEGIIQAEVDLPALVSWRQEFPALQDMHWQC